jgi:Phytochelatin synthase
MTPSERAGRRSFRDSSIGRLGRATRGRADRRPCAGQAPIDEPDPVPASASGRRHGVLVAGRSAAVCRGPRGRRPRRLLSARRTVSHPVGAGGLRSRLARRRAQRDLDEVTCLARCNGAVVELRRAASFDLAAWRASLTAAAHGAGIVIASYDRSAVEQTGGGSLLADRRVPRVAGARPRARCRAVQVSAALASRRAPVAGDARARSVHRSLARLDHAAPPRRRRCARVHAQLRGRRRARANSDVGHVPIHLVDPHHYLIKFN